MDCLFCKIVAGEIPAEKVYENEKILAFMDTTPINPGHILVIPKEHHENLANTPDDLLCDIILTIKKIAPKIQEAVGAEGWNLGVNNGNSAGQVIFHTHFHIMPRFSDDGHTHWSKKPYKEGELKATAEKIREKLL
ncbi:HIT family protein [Patescibacteria group bacterium]